MSIFLETKLVYSNDTVWYESGNTLSKDISIMISRDTFEIPYLIKRGEVLDHVLYHLDGLGAIRHLESILSIDKITAIKWVTRTGEADNGDEKWYTLYD